MYKAPEADLNLLKPYEDMEVIVPEGYPAVLAAVQGLGYKTLLVDTSEYRKLDGGLSCLSLRF